MIIYLIPFIIGFGLGMIPFSYLIGHLKGVNLRNTGSGNIGATNLGRVLGLKFFLLGFILDGLKGIIAVIIARNLCYEPSIAAISAILGHIFNPFFKMRGGKGVATTLGVVLILCPKAFLGALIIWLIIYFSTYLVSLASISAAICLPIISFALNFGNTTERIFFIVISIFIVYAHRPNIKRLLSRKEPKTILWRKV